MFKKRSHINVIRHIVLLKQLKEIIVDLAQPQVTNLHSIKSSESLKLIILINKSFLLFEASYS